MIPYSRQQITPEDIQAVINVLQSDFLTTGPAVRAFEEKLCELTGAADAVVCANGTAALHLACLALEVTTDSLGVTSPLTFLASANCLEYCGGRTDFVDIDPSRLCLSTAALEKYCGEHPAPSVVIPVSYAGVPADLPGIKALAEKYHFRIIEDAAHSIGSTYTHQGKEYASGSCAHSDLATFSFHPVKTITTGEGGAILTRDPALGKKLRLLRSHGMSKEGPETRESPWVYKMDEPGYNYRLTDIQCALGLSQLTRLRILKKERQTQALTYSNMLEDAKDLVLPPWPKNTNPCFHLYPVKFTAGEGMRKIAYQTLIENGIQPQVHYFPVHLQPYYRKKYGYSSGKCPEAENFYNGCLSLPLYPGLSKKDQKKVSNIIKECLIHNS